ncbi:hypothetical protein DFH08DRAFT_1013173, partial [Mycena albidolilacea]
VQLKELTTNTVTADLLVYLASYSGLRRLNLLYAGGRTQVESDRLADTFFEAVLPLHADSLVELLCSGDYESRWSFGTHCVAAISKLHNVETLEMSVDAADVQDADPERNTVTLLLNAAIRLCPPRPHHRRHRRRSEPRRAVRRAAQAAHVSVDPAYQHRCARLSY